jgi:probable phosphoglycerate mutase
MTASARKVPAGVRTVPAGEAAATRIVLVRHGEAVCNVAGVVGGRRGCQGLTTYGRDQVIALARRLAATGELRDATALYASVLPRAVETATLLRPTVGPGDLPVVTDCGLCELHPGASDGLAWEEAVARFGEPDWDRDPTAPLAPGGESWSGFVARAAAAVDAVASAHPGCRTVLACHAGVVEATLLAWLCPGQTRLGLRTAHASLTEWERTSDGWRLLRYNDAAHLAAGPG